MATELEERVEAHKKFAEGGSDEVLDSDVHTLGLTMAVSAQEIVNALSCIHTALVRLSDRLSSIEMDLRAR